MKMKTVREMAEEAGAFFQKDPLDGLTAVDFETDAQLERFAALVRAQALEEAAKIVEQERMPKWAEACDVRDVLAEAIRALVKEQ